MVTPGISCVFDRMHKTISNWTRTCRVSENMYSERMNDRDTWIAWTINIGSHHPLKCVQWVVLLGGALGRMFRWSPHFLFVLYRPDSRENVRS